jgi:hypothetical protein
MNDFFAPPAFKPTDALQTLTRQLRELRELQSRGSSFELRGKPVIKLEALEATLKVSIAKRPATLPVWEQRELRTSAEVRRCLDDVKLLLKRWDDE